MKKHKTMCQNYHGLDYSQIFKASADRQVNNPKSDISIKK